MSVAALDIFRSLRIANYRIWAAGAVVSNIGTWMQRTAQDWLVLTELTHHDASSVGMVMAFQFGPQLLLLPWTGFAADHFDQRKLLMATQAIMGSLALVLGVLTVTSLVLLWHVCLLAFLSGCAAAFDAPVRQTFVAQLVEDADLPNAVALNSASFNAARMVGPAIAGLTISSVGTGLAFLINGASFIAVLVSLFQLRTSTLPSGARAPRERAMRGRIMALRVAVALGGTPIGAPIAGWVADNAGPRWALGLGAASGFGAAIIAAYAISQRNRWPGHDGFDGQST